MDSILKLEDLGYNIQLEKFRVEQKLDDLEIGRVIAEHKERYIVKTLNAEFEAEITGNMRFTSNNREDFPAVGDWVALSAFDTHFAIIHKIFPRFSMIKREAVGQFGGIQIIATNIDYAFIVQAVDRDFNINRIERYLTICNASNVHPIILLNKIDLISDLALEKLISSIQKRVQHIPIIAISNETSKGIGTVKKSILKGKSYCLLGSSGVGKSTLLNNLSGKELMKTASISTHTNKGRHITSHRELIIVENGGIIIDNPGMREVGIADSTHGLDMTFETIINLSAHCKFKDCTHTTETGCAVIIAVENGEIERQAYENYLKMEREKAHFESTVAEKRKKDKDFGKMLKNYKKNRKKDPQ